MIITAWGRIKPPVYRFSVVRFFLFSGPLPLYRVDIFSINLELGGVKNVASAIPIMSKLNKIESALDADFPKDRPFIVSMCNYITL